MRGHAIIWFRRDLRLHDHPALTAALASAEMVTPLFVLDELLLTRGRWPSPNRVAFMLASVQALDTALRRRGSRLHVVRGRPADVVPALAAAWDVGAVHVSRDYSPYARGRDGRIRSALAALGVSFHEHPGTLVHEPEDVYTDAGHPYRVFTPFARRWAALPRRSVLGAPSRLPTPLELPQQPLPNVEGLTEEPANPRLLRAGEAAARARLRRWCAGRVDRYRDLRDAPGEDGTSRLSQDLRWGLLSPLEVVVRCAGSTAGREAFVREIAWREFYYHVLWHFPHVTRAPFRPELSALTYENDPRVIATWQDGRTGYPIVDAAMRQLASDGWMHNRARMIVASFLTKHLLVDWRIGEAFFMRHLVDGDVANNNGGWQWAASTGSDAQPYFRIFNPVAQGEKFDPHGAYVRRWLPELRRVPDRCVHAPWRMTIDEQRAAGCLIGRDYPAPIIDHAEARRRALAAYGAAGAARTRRA